MATSRSSTRQRLIQTALELFVIQGVTDTTTKQIAEQASVNEVTLFRHFGNKYGLLFAVIEESAVFAQLGQALVQRMPKTDHLDEALHAYATAYLKVIDQVPHMARSIVGEAGQYPLENRAALGRGLAEANQTVADYFNAVAARGHWSFRFSSKSFTSLLNSLLLGYAVIELTSDSHDFWENQDQFIEHLISLFTSGPLSEAVLEAQSVVRSPDIASEGLSARVSISDADSSTDYLSEQARSPHRVADLPASLVQELLQRAKRSGPRDYALFYVMFGAGLSPDEVTQLERSHHISDRTQHILHVSQRQGRHVPINQWIMGKRYGSYRKNPLTQWLKSRQDSHPALFPNSRGDASITVAEIQQIWQELTRDLTTLAGQPPTPDQAQQTWCVEMLMRGMSQASIAVLTGWDIQQLTPYVQRAEEKAALDQAIRLDKKPSNGSDAAT